MTAITSAVIFFLLSFSDPAIEAMFPTRSVPETIKRRGRRQYHGEPESTMCTGGNGDVTKRRGLFQTWRALRHGMVKMSGHVQRVSVAKEESQKATTSKISIDASTRPVVGIG